MTSTHSYAGREPGALYAAVWNPIAGPNRRRSLMLSVIGLFIAAGPSPTQETAAQPKITTLIVDGFSNHDWLKTTAFIDATLAETGMFEVAVTTSPGEPDAPGWEEWRPTFSDHDVVVLNSNNIHQPDIRWPRRVERDLEAYVRDGGGLLVFHSANNAFPHWPEYDRMIGLGWRDKDHGVALQLDAEGKIRRIPAGEGERTSHGPRQDTVVIRLDAHLIALEAKTGRVKWDIELGKGADNLNAKQPPLVVGDRLFVGIVGRGPGVLRSQSKRLGQRVRATAQDDSGRFKRTEAKSSDSQPRRFQRGDRLPYRSGRVVAARRRDVDLGAPQEAG